RLASQPSLTSETKPFWAKRSRLTESNSLDLFETCVSTSSETTVTPIISGTSAFTEEAPQSQEDIITNPSVTVGTSIPKTAPSRVEPGTEIHLPEHLEVEFQNSKGVAPLISVTTEAITS
ncbi:Hypothetical predicted protein, partial [Olea europaea subsp. europaea]